MKSCLQEFTFLWLFHLTEISGLRPFHWPAERRDIKTDIYTYSTKLETVELNVKGFNCTAGSNGQSEHFLWNSFPACVTTAPLPNNVELTVTVWMMDCLLVCHCSKYFISAYLNLCFFIISQLYCLFFLIFRHSCDNALSPSGPLCSSCLCCLSQLTYVVSNKLCEYTVHKITESSLY